MQLQERGFTSNTGNKSGPSGGSTPNKGGAVSAVGKLGSSFTGVAKGGAGQCGRGIWGGGEACYLGGGEDLLSTVLLVSW